MGSGAPTWFRHSRGKDSTMIFAVAAAMAPKYSAWSYSQVLKKKKKKKNPQKDLLLVLFIYVVGVVVL